jgi:uncharacterized protein (TIGR02145 family)
MSKNKAWIQYTKQGEIVPGSLIVSPRRPKNGIWYETITDICCDTEPPFGVINSKQKAFVKYDASGNIVPGSLILTDGRLPRPGIWKEVYINICCATSPAPITDVVIGTQTWLLGNLNVDTYSNGDPIPQVTDPTQWATLTTGAWTYYNNNSANGPIYGKLYNWYAATDPRGLAPVGYHIPDNSEWDTLMNYLGGSPVAGGAMKSTTLWNAPNTGATNSSGFTGLPGGDFTSTYNNLGDLGIFWSATSFNATFSHVRILNNSSSILDDSQFSQKNRGSSVRAIKD